ncbi:peptidoglycan DD-metalloendopeptidase family protein [Enterococcus mundtii]|uniref:peptidoglycan DD-metalloendopeptidase family protein n=1 Tax=Enterococcus mundtii TaxID=53346 RepID=UPI001E52E267|nr:peptidoglycan DD-metalloendopeptidase family protein [Enterococcus mundtii]MDV7745160.1 peptidoglycan DD-metalloendopeptidase family protein [Enterococcus mundtii]
MEKEKILYKNGKKIIIRSTSITKRNVYKRKIAGALMVLGTVASSFSHSIASADQIITNTLEIEETPSPSIDEMVLSETTTNSDGDLLEAEEEGEVSKEEDLEVISPSPVPEVPHQPAPEIYPQQSAPETPKPPISRPPTITSETPTTPPPTGSETNVSEGSGINDVGSVPIQTEPEGEAWRSTSESSLEAVPIEAVPTETGESVTETKGPTARTEQSNIFFRGFSANTTTEAFIQEIAPGARKVALSNDLYASVMIAQAILESGSGSSQLSSSPHYNLFGIKAYTEEDSVEFLTQEDDGTGNLYTISARFKSYESYEESFLDYAKLLREGLTHDADFYSGVWRSNTSSYQDATRFLTGRYATDTSYYQKLDALIDVYDLEKFDIEIDELMMGENGFINPLEHFTITSHYGMRGAEFHRGIDLAANAGAPIFASEAGTVIKSEYHASWGNVISIRHENGLFTLYAHQSVNVVEPGQVVQKGEVIGFVGSTGNSTGPHLHFELSTDASMEQQFLIDPLEIMRL